MKLYVSALLFLCLWMGLPSAAEVAFKYSFLRSMGHPDDYGKYRRQAGFRPDGNENSGPFNFPSPPPPSDNWSGSPGPNGGDDFDSNQDCSACTAIQTNCNDLSEWQCIRPNIQYLSGQSGNCLTAVVNCPTNSHSELTSETGVTFDAGFGTGAMFTCSSDGWSGEDQDGNGITFSSLQCNSFN